jgi:O-antigen ligase
MAITNYRQTDSRYYFFLGILFLAFIVQSSAVLDYTLWPKVLLLGIGFSGLILSNFNYYLEALRKQTVISLLLLSLLAWTTTSATWAVSVPESLGEITKTALCWLIFNFCYAELKSQPNRVLQLYQMMAVVLTISLIFGMTEVLRLESYSADSMYAVTSICGHRNAFSSFIFLASIFNILLFYKGRGFWKWLALINIILGLFFILMLQTRALYLATIGAAVCYAVLYILVYKKWNIAIAVGIVIIVSISLLLIFKNNQSLPILHKANIFNYSQSASGAERLKVWKKTWNLFTEHPIIGVGAGSWQFLYLQHGWGDLAYLNDSHTTFQRPHNDFLWVASELGLVGFLIWISIFLIPIFLGVRCLFSKNYLESKNSNMLLISGVIGYLVISFFDFPKERTQHLLLIIAMLSVLYVQSTSDKNAFFTAPKYFIWMAFLLSAGVTVISWQRLRSEHFMAEVYRYRSQQSWARVIKFIDKINASFYDTDPTSLPVKWYSGLAYFSMGEYAKAKQDLAQACAISPYNPHVLNNYASANEMLGNHEEAKKYYERALRLLPTFDESLLNLAAIYFNENNIEKAKSLILQAKPSERKDKYLEAVNSR